MKRVFGNSFLIIFISASSVLAQTTVISSPYSSTIDIPQLNTSPALVSNFLVNCVDLPYDLYQGLSDSISNESVIKLQRFLAGSGYLTASPNGYFGPATLSALKRFQNTYNINSTGRAGPQTRAKIKSLTCNSNTASVINAISTPRPVYPEIDRNTITVSSPTASSTLSTDSYERIVWKKIDRAIYSISLEDQNGLGVGHVAQSISGNEYNWNVGKVYSAKTNSEIFVKPGIYRIHITGVGYNNNVPDQYSGLFTIVGKPITIRNIIPSSISTSKMSYVAISGSGFDETSVVNLEVNGHKRVIKPQYISPDGKIIVFGMSTVQNGQFWLSVYNTYDDGATSTPSNPVSLNIDNI